VDTSGDSFKFNLKVGVQESIVNALLVRLQSKNTDNAKSEVKTADSCLITNVVRSQSTIQLQFWE
jgi:hypothetical protein